MTTLRRWAPLVAGIAIVVAGVLRLLGKATEAESIEALVQMLGFQTGITPTEVGALAALGVGLFLKLKSLYQEAQPPRLPLIPPPSK